MVDQMNIFPATQIEQDALSAYILKKITVIKPSWLELVCKTRLSANDEGDLLTRKICQIFRTNSVWGPGPHVRDVISNFRRLEAPPKFHKYVPASCSDPSLSTVEDSRKVAQKVSASYWLDLLTHIARQSAALWTNIVLIFAHFDLKLELCDFHQFCAFALFGGLRKSVETYFKYAFTDAFCHWTKQNEHPNPPPFVVSGVFFALFPSMGRQLKRLSYGWAWDPSTRHSFAYSVMMAKKGTEAIPWWDVDAGLSGFAKIAELDVQETQDDETILQEIERTVHELFRPKDGQKQFIGSLLPSMSAHVGWSRKEGGGTSALYEMCTSHRPTENVGGIDVKIPDAFELLRAAEGVAKSDFVEGKVHLVKEPFKLRSITTGPPNDAYLGKYLNRIIHKRVRKHPAFSFADRDVNLNDLEGFQLDGNEFLVSADYEAATDNLKTRYTAWTWLCLCKRLCFADWVFFWGLKSLTRNKWEMPNGKFVMQGKTIQPMGNCLSFPLLCVINFALVRAVVVADRAEFIRDHRRIPSLEKRREAALDVWRVAHDQIKREDCIKINGDDALFKLYSLKSYEYFKRLTSSAGLIPSIGKNFISRDFGMINSKLLLIRRNFFGSGRVTDLVPYVNVGLIKGTGRVLSDTRVEKVSHDPFYGSIGESSSALVKGFGLVKADQLLSQFIRWNMDKLGTTWRDWYLPRTLGGLELVNLGTRPLPKMSKAAAIVAQHAFNILGVCIDSTPVELNCSSKNYRKAIPMTSTRIDDLPEDEVHDLRDDSYFFWTDEVSSMEGRNRPDSEQMFKNLYRKALSKGVNPMIGRQNFRFRMEPLFQLVPIRQINIFTHNL
jgi:hypothetical protein